MTSPEIIHEAELKAKDFNKSVDLKKIVTIQLN